MNAISLAYYQPDARVTSEPVHEADVIVYGATAAGIMAAAEIRARGRRVLVLNPGWHVGGMTTSGLGFTDFGNEAVIGGRARQFYEAIGRHYGQPIGWSFEPGVAMKSLNEFIRESGISVLHGFYVAEVFKRGTWIVELVSTSGRRVRGAMFIDTSYEGDLMARAGVSYATGRESSSQYGEAYNGAQILDKNQFEHRVDPYVRPGVPASGLLPGVHRGDAPMRGAGDQLIQAYNFRTCMTRRKELLVRFPRPHDYDERQYELLARYFEAGWDMDLRPDGTFAKYDEVACGKTDTNNGGGFASDFIGGNWEYPEAGYERREEIFQAHVNYQQGLLYFLQNSRRVPPPVSAAINRYGLAGDEFTQTGHWPPQLYVRECRRLKGEVVVTEHHCLGRERALQSIGMAAYTMDSHNCQRVVVDGRVLNEGDVQVSLPAPYGIPYQAIVPRRGECENLLVPVCLSATHIAFGSIRMEPVFMGLAQSAAVAACLCLPELRAVQDLDYAKLRPELQATNLVLELDEIAPACRANLHGNPVTVPI
jgi:hypothetical protein